MPDIIDVSYSSGDQAGYLAGPRHQYPFEAAVGSGGKIFYSGRPKLGDRP